MDIYNYGKLGYVKHGNDTFSFQIGKQALTTGAINFDEFPNYTKPILYKIGPYNVLYNGEYNLMPQEVKQMIGGNRLLPQLIEKQVKFLYGNGPMTYVAETVGGKPTRRWDHNKQIMDWLDSWRTNGLADSYQMYFNKIIRDGYYLESNWKRWRFTAARRIGGGMPVAGLEHISQTRARFATKKDFNQFTEDYEDRDFQTILVGNWNYPTTDGYKAYKRLNYANPLTSPTAISYSKNPSFGEEVYAYNSYYKGVKEWIKGSNATPKNINSFIENSIAARLHIIIPQAWVEDKEELIQRIVKENDEREDATKPFKKLVVGKTTIEIGTSYKSEYLTQYMNAELKKLASVLSGESNQGKMYATTAYGSGPEAQQWKIEEFPLKYKEYFEALLKYDERSDQVLLSSLGLDASLSNVSKEGVISKSGADAYYNYLIYLLNLTIPEHTATEDVNFAIRLNFPDLYAEGFRIGFYNSAPQRQEEISQGNRMQNNLNE